MQKIQHNKAAVKKAPIKIKRKQNDKPEIDYITTYF